MSDKKTTTSAINLKAGLAQFYGSLNVYQYSPFLFPSFMLTDGAKYLAEQGGYYWLMDYIASLHVYKVIESATSWDLHLWKLKTNIDDGTAILTCSVTDDEILYSKKIPFTDSILEEITLCVGRSVFTNGKPYTVCCLISER